MKTKYMDVACYSILLVAVAMIGIQLTTPASVSGQEEEEESIITSIAKDGQNAQDNTQLTTPASVSGQEQEEESTITPIAQDGQTVQSGPGVFPRIASLDDNAGVAGGGNGGTSNQYQDNSDGEGSATQTNGRGSIEQDDADVTDNEEANGESVAGTEQVANGEDNNVDIGLGNGADGPSNQVDSGVDNGVDGAAGKPGLDGADGIGRDGADGTTEDVDGEVGADAFALQLEASIP
jgi:hypothetical protein